MSDRTVLEGGTIASAWDRPPSRAVPPPAVQALTGVLAASLALSASALAAAGLRRPTASPVVAVGGLVIDHTPVWLKDFAIRELGTHDKLVLLLGIVVAVAGYAAAVGVVAFRRLLLGAIGVAAFALLGAAAALSRPGAGPVVVVPAVAGAAAGAGVLVALVRAASGPHVEPSPGGTSGAGRRRDWDRRRFLATGLGVVALAVAGGQLARLLARSADLLASRARVRLPDPAVAAPPLPAGTDLGVPGVTPFVTQVGDFYRVDTALVLPSLTAEDWRLRVHGMVDRELSMSFAELLARPLVERDITLTCVSNEVGGPYAGNARWLGYPIQDLLDEVGVQPGSDQLVSRSVDGFSAGTPVAAVQDGRAALLAVAMNGEPLPQAHGFPVRMLVPGLYGFVSATKWLVDLELTTYGAYDAYWTQRGWATDAPIKTMARIDTPRPLANVSGPKVAVGGVAWAQHRGIERVEVRVDGGAWHEARLGEVPTSDTWRQWVWAWEPTPGRHTLEARATDASGTPQTAERARPFPAGASGLHSVVVTAA